MAKKKRLSRFSWFLIIYMVIYVVVAYFAIKTMQPLTSVGQRWIIHFGRFFFWAVNPMTLIMSWVLMTILVFIGYQYKKKQKLIPDRKQSLIEWILSFIYHDMVEGAFEDKEFARKTVFPFAATLMLFVTFSNILGGIPGIQTAVENEHLKSFTLFQDTWYSPTSDLNTNLTYALMVLFVAHGLAIKKKGLKRYLKSYVEPFIFMLPLNIISEISKVISHSFRLFGNIAGGGILVLVLSYMVKYFILPVALWGFFGFFVGVVQAMVYSMLAVAYISVQTEG
ncbi:MAG: F0F1 ATP synthase subunit A [Thermotoga sp.]|nr:MAG: F0F1 ATP synthase subunit A [Thermotoga sp.]